MQQRGVPWRLGQRSRVGGRSRELGAWARTPGHDAYWYYRDIFFDVTMPAPGRHTLEIGCGEGRVTRDLVSRGHRVVALDRAPTLVRHAAQSYVASAYLVAEGAELPFPDQCFDIVVAYNSLQVVPDMAGTVSEAARVLEPGGSFCICVSHPVTDMGRFVGDDADAPFTLRRQYFERTRVEDTVRVGDLTMTFRGWTYTLEDYFVALQHAGLRIEALGEPLPANGARFDRWRTVPLFLDLRAVKT